MDFCKRHTVAETNTHRPPRAAASAALAGGSAWLALAAVVAAVLALPARAAETAPAGEAAASAPMPEAVDLTAAVTRWLAEHPAAAAAPAGQRIDITVGTPDRRLRLAPCARTEVALPAGMRLWGRSHVAVRCIAGATHWSVFVPLEVKVWARGLVARASLPTGSLLGADDVAEGEVDLAEDAAAALPPSIDAAAGRVLQRPLAAGQGLRLSHLKPRIWFAAGDIVRVVTAGDGFSVTGEGTAITPGIEGLPARVRTESGRVLSGIPTARQLVELPL